MKISDRIRAVLRAEAEAILSVNVTDAFEQAVRSLEDCRGKIATVGIGKAGHVAHKFAATLCSTGSPAVFLHPAEAAHGDLGMLDSSDILVAFSTSGKSREVLEVLELSRHLGVEHIIGITSHPDSAFRSFCDLILDMGSIAEACPLGLTPTSSIAVMLAISDSVAIALAEKKGFTRDEFGKRHHGGYLGKISRIENIQNEK